MSKLVLAICLVVIVPALRAQQVETSGSSPQAATQVESQPAAQNLKEQDNLPAAIRPGHPLDPADVDILTGKRDREIEAARRLAAAPVMVGAYGGYGFYGSYYRMDSRLGAAWDSPLLPLARITSPFFFSRMSPRGFGRGGFLRGR